MRYFTVPHRMNRDNNLDTEMNSSPTNYLDSDIPTQGQPLSDFLMQLEDYNPTVSTLQ